jgi:succinyl-CoA synthetase alpha subunit
MTELILTTDTCERKGCLQSLRFQRTTAVLVFLGQANGLTETVKVYCSHACEARARPIPAWVCKTRKPKKRRR